jgi:hypothetical protein
LRQDAESTQFERFFFQESLDNFGLLPADFVMSYKYTSGIVHQNASPVFYIYPSDFNDIEYRTPKASGEVPGRGYGPTTHPIVAS